MKISAQFKVGNGVRQGSSLSPSLFNVFINKVIMNIKRLDLGCFVNMDRSDACFMRMI